MADHVVIVGGGIVGLACAKELTERGARVTLLEKASRWGAHQSGHNSGVIHAGPYYRPGSLKAQMCREGNRSMVAFAQEHGIAHDVCGKLIVATREAELPALERLHANALANQTPVRRIDADEVREREPHVRAAGALWVDSTGIIDYGAVCRTYADLASARGADLRLGAAVEGISARRDEIVVTTSGSEVRADLLVNAAGLHSDKIAALAGVRPEVRIVPFRGEYYELTPQTRHLVKGLVYPVPDPELPFLGVHLTRMIDGSVHAGPNAVLAGAREGYRWRDVDPREMVEVLRYPGFRRLARSQVRNGAREIARSLSRTRFAASLAELVPAISKRDIVRAEAGVRAQAVRPDGRLADDFVLQRADRQLHVLNAPSPAATSSLEIGRWVGDAALQQLA